MSVNWLALLLAVVSLPAAAFVIYALFEWFDEIMVCLCGLALILGAYTLWEGVLA